MAKEQFFPFDSVKQSNGKGDRIYKSQSWADYYKNLISTGLMHQNGKTGLQIVGIENLEIEISSGGAFIEGRQYLLTENAKIQIDIEQNMYRNDFLVLRMDNRVNARSISLQVLKGEPSLEKHNAVAPNIVRNDDIYDLGLYTILVTPQAVKIETENIVDHRGNSDYCSLSNPKGFGAATIYIGKEKPPTQFLKPGDIWMPEIER